MTEIKLNGKRLPSPDVYNIGSEVVGSFERNANGNLVGDFVAMKATLALGWKMLDGASFKAIAGGAAPIFGMVEYHDPAKSCVVQKQMHIRPGGAKVALGADGKIWWRDVRCDFVER